MSHNELVIEHYGVKGMKWGIRRAREEIRSRSQSAKRERSWKTQYRSRETMTNEELTAAINRLQLENQFAKLAGEATAKQRKQAKSMFDKASSIMMSDEGKQVMATIVRKAMTGGVL